MVDDEPTLTDLLAELLDEEGYRVRRAYDGRQALAEITADAPDLMVSDVTMPGIDGLTLVRMLRSRGDRTPVVLMSAVSIAVDIPGVEFVPKPFDVDSLLLTIGRVLADPPR